MKVCIAAMTSLIRVLRKLYMNRAGIATSRPTVVAKSALAMPGAIELTSTSPDLAMIAKVIMTPTTVPSSPT